MENRICFISLVSQKTTKTHDCNNHKNDMGIKFFNLWLCCCSINWTTHHLSTLASTAYTMTHHFLLPLEKCLTVGKLECTLGCRLCCIFWLKKPTTAETNFDSSFSALHILLCAGVNIIQIKTSHQHLGCSCIHVEQQCDQLQISD